jgi:hypothetical protein
MNTPASSTPQHWYSVRWARSVADLPTARQPPQKTQPTFEISFARLQ